MNKSRILILVIGVAVVIAFSLYSFNPFLAAPKAGTKIEPAKNLVSLVNPSNNTIQQNLPMPSGASKMSVFENHDSAGNYYSIQFPSEANVEHGEKPGSFIARLSQSTLSVELVDIPDNSNVQLHILTQDEPSLKSSLQDYNRVSLNQIKIGDTRSWNLVYMWKNGTSGMESMKTFVEGSDNAALITFSGPSQEFGQSNSTINSVMESFRWIGQ